MSIVTRPKNMVIIRITLLASVNELVIPLLNPTVPYAKTTSKAILSNPCVGSIIMMANEEAPIHINSFVINVVGRSISATFT